MARGKRKAATTARKAKTKAPGAPKGKRPDGSVSSGIYDAVQKLIADGKMTRTAAFKQIAKESGRKEGTVSANYYYAAKKHGGGKKSAVKKVAAKPAARVVKSVKSAAGGVSTMIYDAIEKLVAGGKMTRAAAFRQHAKATGRKEGTVAVNYYYAAKKRGGGAKLVKRGPGRPRMAVAGKRAAANGSSGIEAVLKSLAELVRTQQSEIDQLKREGERFAVIRRLVA